MLPGDAPVERATIPPRHPLPLTDRLYRNDVEPGRPETLAFTDVTQRAGLQASGYGTVVLDNDLATIQLMRRFGFTGYFGDPCRPELLTAAGLDTAKVLVVAVDSRKDAVQLVRYARRVRPDIAITARAHDRLHVYELYNAGADHIVREMFDSSLRAARYVLEDVGLTVLRNPIGGNEVVLQLLVPTLMTGALDALQSSLGTFPLPAFLGLDLQLVDLDRNGEYMSLFLDLQPVP